MEEQTYKEKIRRLCAAQGPEAVLEVVALYINDSLERYSSLKLNERQRAKWSYSKGFTKNLFK